MDITSMLQYYKNVGVTGTVASKQTVTGTTSEESTATSFSNLLNEEVSELKESQSLAAALDGTVLSGLGNLSDLSAEMLKTSSGQRMLQELMNGQFASVVTASEEDKKDEQTVSEAVLGNGQNADARFEKVVSELEDAIATMKTTEKADTKDES